MRDLGTSRADDSIGVAVNRAGKVVGQIIRIGTWAARACTWSDGKVETLDTSTDVGSSESGGVSNNGQVVGALREPGLPFTEREIHGISFADHAVLMPPQGGH